MKRDARRLLTIVAVVLVMVAAISLAQAIADPHKYTDCPAPPTTTVP